MFDIISKDALRKQIENSSNNELTVLYDDKGYPSFMSVIPKMTIGDCFPADVGDSQLNNYLTETHPAFLVYDETGQLEREVNEIFVSQYRCTYIDGTAGDYSTYRAISMPGQVGSAFPYKSGSNYQMRQMIEAKGSNWHMMNIWEYSALQFWGYMHDKTVAGNQLGTGEDYDGKTGVVGTWGLKLTASVASWTVNEQIVGLTSGAVGVLTSTDTIDSVTVLNVEDVYGVQFLDGEVVEGQTSGRTGTIDEITGNVVGGFGPLNWSHNHKHTGVWNMIGEGEWVDGLRTKSFTYGSDTCYLIQATPGNYYGWTDGLLENHTAKFSDRQVPAQNKPQLGYQELDFSGAPVVGSNNDVDITNVTSWTDNSATLPVSANYTANAYPYTRKMLTIAGFDMVTFPDVLLSNLRHSTGLYSSAPANGILIKGFSPNGNYCGMWTNRFRVETTAAKYKFRMSYIPS